MFGHFPVTFLTLQSYSKQSWRRRTTRKFLAINVTSQVGPGDLGPFHCIVNHTLIMSVAEHVSSCLLMFSSETEGLILPVRGGGGGGWDDPQRIFKHNSA